MIATTSTTTWILERLHDPADAAVWRAFDGRFRPILVGFARRLGLNETDAADLAQETLASFVEAYRSGRYDRTKGRLRSWIIGIARHRLLDMRASANRRQGWRGHSAIERVPDDEHLTQIWESERQGAILSRAMEELRSSSRTSPQSIRAFELVVFEGQKPEDAAATLDMSRHDVYVAKHRVTDRLRQIVSRLEALYDSED